MKPELFFGLVGAIGTDLRRVSQILTRLLSEYGYVSTPVRLSNLLKGVFPDLPERPEETRIERLMDAGDRLRSGTALGSALALLGIAQVREERKRITPKSDGTLDKHAFIFDSLKHPKEVEILRRIYGEAFLLIGAYSRREARLENLSRRIAESHNAAKTADFLGPSQQLVRRDEEDIKTEYGQNVRRTFPVADVFVNASSPVDIDNSLGRFLELLFASQFHTPTRDEFGMFQAEAVALRSAALGRQVGAAITSSDGEVIALGCNDVPKAGGGLYWEEDSPDHRDFRLGYDTNDRIKKSVLAEVLDHLKRHELLRENSEKSVEQVLNEALAHSGSRSMRQTQLMNLTEFGRDVHAEMAALMDAARRGVAVRGATLFTTTFPCHNCAKHIVAAGIDRVVYVAPYPKSLAAELYPDSIVVDAEACGGQVAFEPFVGVAPVKYRSFFIAGERKNDFDGSVLSWEKNAATPRFVGVPALYLTQEEENLNLLYDKLRNAGLIRKKEAHDQPRS